MDKGAGVKGEDIPISRLVPLHSRKANKKGYNRILASIKAVGLIEPLCVYEESGQFIILDGYLRYRACLELSIATVPCLILSTKEAYTPNRMISHLSPVQENRMLHKSLGTIDESTIAKALGWVSIRHRLKDSLLKQLHKDVIAAFDKRSIPLRACAKEFTHVKPEYQAVVLEEMERVGDYSPAFVRTLILRAPDQMRNEKGRRKSPWRLGSRQKAELTEKLEKAEERYEFYAGLYRQYVADLLKLCIYVRTLMNNTRIAAHMKANHPEILEKFEEIIYETEGKKVS